MLDRSQTPPIHTFSSLQLTRPRLLRLRNGLPVYILDKGTQEVTRLEVVYLAGRPFEARPLLARAATGLLKEGTRSRSAEDLSEFFDFYGATLSFPFNLDTASVILYALNRHLPDLLPVFAEMLAEPAFSEKELETFVRRNQQALRDDLSKNDVVSYREITAHIFGESHPYGYNSTPETYTDLRREDIAAHHQRLMHANNAFVILSGRITSEIEQLIDTYLGDLPGGSPAPALDLHPSTLSPRPVKIARPETLQTSVRLGRRLFTRRHEDYAGMFVLNTILGGYFGSRLMENIREDKGYTYNIYSSVDTMRYDGAFHIGAEVGNEHVAGTLKEIEHEMAVLREELVDEEELAMVRNYLMGNFLTMLDGPFNISEAISTLLSDDAPLEDFEKLVATVSQITPEDLRELARRYLDIEDYWLVTVGP